MRRARRIQEMHRGQGVMKGILKRSKFYGPRCFEQSFGDLRRE
jgi:hypothetical protein